jgi:hypothetical protein
LNVRYLFSSCSHAVKGQNENIADRATESAWPARATVRQKAPASR